MAIKLPTIMYPKIPTSASITAAQSSALGSWRQTQMDDMAKREVAQPSAPSGLMNAWARPMPAPVSQTQPANPNAPATIEQKIAELYNNKVPPQIATLINPERRAQFEQQHPRGRIISSLAQIVIQGYTTGRYSKDTLMKILTQLSYPNNDNLIIDIRRQLIGESMAEREQYQ